MNIWQGNVVEGVFVWEPRPSKEAVPKCCDLVYVDTVWRRATELDTVTRGE